MWKLFCLHGNYFLSSSLGWVNRKQQDAIEYLLTENRLLREKLGRPSDRGLSEHLRHLQRRSPNSGQAADCRAFCHSETDFRPAIRCLPRVLPVSFLAFLISPCAPE